MEMSEHTSKQFDVELENIRTKVLQMGGLVEQQVERAMDGLASGEMYVIVPSREPSLVLMKLLSSILAMPKSRIFGVIRSSVMWSMMLAGLISR